MNRGERGRFPAARQLPKYAKIRANGPAFGVKQRHSAAYG